MAEAVVHHLEAVEVDEEDGDRRRPSRVAHQRLLEAVDEEGTVGQTGERVVERLVGERDLRALALDGVAQRAGEQLAVDAALDQVVLGSLLQRLDGDAEVVAPGDDDDRQLRREQLQPLDRLEAVGVGEAQVDEDTAGPGKALPGGLEPVDVLQLEEPVGGVVEHERDQPCIAGVVLDEEDAVAQFRVGGLAHDGGS